jgi:hypothetical protein
VQKKHARIAGGVMFSRHGPRPGGRGGMMRANAYNSQQTHGGQTSGHGHGHCQSSSTSEPTELDFDITQSMHVIIDALRDNNVEIDRLDHFLVDFADRNGSIGEDEFDIEAANIALRMNFYEMLYIACLKDRLRFPIFHNDLSDKVHRAIRVCGTGTPKLVENNLKRLQTALRK